MNCDGVSSLLSAYIDGELSPGELLRVEEHLRRCHACADEVDSLRQTIALVASLEEVEVPASFQLQLHQRLVALGPPVAAVRRAPAAPAWQRNMRRWAVPAAAAAAALAIGVTQFNPTATLRVGLNGGEGKYQFSPKENPGQQVTTNMADPGANTTQQPPQEVVQPPVAPPPVDPAPPKVTDNTQPVTPPGKTNPNDGPKTATPGSETVTAPVAKQMVYTYNITVNSALDPKTEEAVKAEYTLVEKGTNNLIIKVPVQVAESVRDRLIHTYWVGSAVTEAHQDRGAEIADAQSRADAARRQLEQLKTEPGAEKAMIEAAQQEFDDAQASYDVLKNQTTFATFIVTFTPAQ